MKKRLTTPMFVLLFSFMVTVVTAQNSSAYVHEATPASISSSKTILDTIVFNGNSNMNFMALHNYNPGGGSGSAVDEKLGLRFQSLKWYIINQDLSAFSPNTFYNVFIPGDDVHDWKHTTENSNLINNYTVINDGRINNNPNAKVFVFDQMANYNKEVLGVFYSTAQSKWCIFNQDANEDMPANLDFSILVPKANTGYETVIHTADGNNTSNHFTYLNHSDLNGNPEAIIFVTQVWNPGGTATGVYNNHNVGVQYRSNNRWAIYNEDLENMPLGASFNVMIFRNNSIGIDEITIDTKHLKLSPNPVVAGNSAMLELDAELEGLVGIEVYGLTGQLVQKQELTKATAGMQMDITTAGLSPGMYVIKVTNNGKVGVQRLIIQ